MVCVRLSYFLTAEAAVSFVSSRAKKNYAEIKTRNYLMSLVLFQTCSKQLNAMNYLPTTKPSVSVNPP